MASNNDLEHAIARAGGAAAGRVNDARARPAPPVEIRPQTALGVGALGPPLDGQTPVEPHAGASQPDAAPAPTEALRSPKSGRRGSRSGRRSSPNLSAAREPESTASEPATRPFHGGHGSVVPTKRFEDEVTVEHERPTVIVRYDDLDEKTNVIGGLLGEDGRAEEPAEEPAAAPPSSRGRRRAAANGQAADAEHRKKTVVPSEPPPALANELSRITSFRVALVSDAARGTVEVIPLVPNEPAPAGLVTAILVPVDGTSSRQIAEILASKKRER